MMTRKHYTKLAGILGTHRGRVAAGDPDTYGLEAALIAWLVEDNPRFDAVRFLEAVDQAKDAYTTLEKVSAVWREIEKREQ